uniref:NADP-dependent oxidoreductase domain-containing protein n=1 Tax=Ciona savignyi TaxID=51511 RepID=H2YBF0_CIOSA
MLGAKTLLLSVFVMYVYCEEDPIINDNSAGTLDDSDSNSRYVITMDKGEENIDETISDQNKKEESKIPMEEEQVSPKPERKDVEEYDDDEVVSPVKRQEQLNVTLKSGHKMPLLGLGTYRLGTATYRITKEALEIGYRLIDTAKIYEASRKETSEQAIGKAIQASGVPRSEIFITTKIMPDLFGKTEMRKAVQNSLRALQTDYLDLLLIHYPDCGGDPYCKATGTFVEGWNHMAELVEEGLIRDIGVSNMFMEEVEKIWVETTAPISVVQNWFDPYYQDRSVRMLASKRGIMYTGYSALGVGWVDDGMKKNPVLTDSTIKQIADRRNCAPSDVILKWAITRGVAVIPGTTKSAHLRMNFNSLKVKLTEDDLMIMDSLDNKIKPLNDYGKQVSGGFGFGSILGGLLNLGKSVGSLFGFGGSSSGITGGEL